MKIYENTLDFTFLVSKETVGLRVPVIEKANFSRLNKKRKKQNKETKLIIWGIMADTTE